MKARKKILAILLCITTMWQITGCKKEEEKPVIQLQSIYSGETVDLCTDTVREYLNAKKEKEQLNILIGHVGQNMAFQTALFSWSSDGVSKVYTVHFADNEAFENEITYETYHTSLGKQGCLIPGKTYYWKVTGDAEGSTSEVDCFQTLDAPVRYISTESIPNVRDIGGWKTEDGKKVKYAMLYRGGKTNPSGGNTCAPEDRELFVKRLGVKTEIDLRTSGADDGDQTYSVFGDGVMYYKTPLTQFCYIFPDFEQTEPMSRSYDLRVKYSVQQIFELLAEEENYPIFFHCNGGADRTATVAFLINGLLGVSYEDLTRDCELTTFSPAGARWRSGVKNGKFDSSGVYQDNSDNYVAWGKMYDMMMEEYGTKDGKLSTAIENYLIEECALEKETLDVVRSIMLDD